MSKNLSNRNHNNTDITVFALHNESTKFYQYNLKYHVFISKETTKELASYLMNEKWGYQCGVLYKYIDYTWRCQLIDKEIRKFYYKSKPKLVFNTGLLRKSDNKCVYLLLIQNDAYFKNKKVVYQRWRVAFGSTNDHGNIKNNISFVTEQDLLYKYGFTKNDIPKKTIFYNKNTKLIYDTTYNFIIDWDERIRTSKDRICKALLSDIKYTQAISRQKLRGIFEYNVNIALENVKKNQNLVTPQAFVEQNCDESIGSGGYHLELLLPFTIELNGKTAYFALALRPFHNKRCYEGMSILTRKMAYANARLIGPVTVDWLKPFVSTNKLKSSNDIRKALMGNTTNNNNINININKGNCNNNDDIDVKSVVDTPTSVLTNNNTYNFNIFNDNNNNNNNNSNANYNYNNNNNNNINNKMGGSDTLKDKIAKLMDNINPPITDIPYLPLINLNLVSSLPNKNSNINGPQQLRSNNNNNNNNNNNGGSIPFQRALTEPLNLLPILHTPKSTGINDDNNNNTITNSSSVTNSNNTSPHNNNNNNNNNTYNCFYHNNILINQFDIETSNNIMNVWNDRLYLNVINWFDNFISGFNHNKSLNQLECDILITLLDNNYNNSSLNVPNYIQSLFNNFCFHKKGIQRFINNMLLCDINFFGIHLNSFVVNFHRLYKYLFIQDHKRIKIDNNKIVKIFPNMKGYIDPYGSYIKV